MRAFLTQLVAIVVGLGVMIAAGQTMACDTGCAPPPPPTPPHNPSPPGVPCNCGGGSTSNASASASARASAFSNASASAGASYYGGGYGNWSQAQGIPQPGGALMVETAEEGGYEAYSEQRTMTSYMALEASCIDDMGVPHPASQLGPDRNVDGRYVGELYRCIAGTHMQWTLVDLACGTDAAVQGGSYAYSESASRSSSSSYSRSSSRGVSHSGRGYADGHSDSYSTEHRSDFGGSSHSDSAHGGCPTCVAVDAPQCHANLNHISFDGGKTMSCQKGDALWFEKGALSCRPQLPQRSCNERSLLRRFGVGIKLLTVTRTESVTKQRQMAYQKSTSSSSVMTFDGGVGGFVQ